MKISTRTRYGLRLLVYLAGSDPDTLLQVKEIAKHEDIPAKYLEQIIRPLKKAGLLKVVRGAKGGYFMDRDPETISVREVFDLLENSTSLIDCLKDKNSCEHKDSCSTFDFWDNFNKLINDYLEGVTLADILKMQREKCKKLMFYI
jgi:Rrf2 family transcriptional regulator, cysteine metabolism repressor